MQGVIHSLHSFFDSLLNSPHHLMVYIAIAAVLLVCIPLMRLIFRSRRGSDDVTAFEGVSTSVLGLTSPSLSSSPVIDSDPAPLEFTRKPPASVTAIHESLTVPCIHCGVTMSSRQDFCPACGYAQPVKQSLTAAFPA
ncbi:MAG TPA: hypothetical protein VGM02_12400 [Acidobacteriaceae bacterium]